MQRKFVVDLAANHDQKTISVVITCSRGDYEDVLYDARIAKFDLQAIINTVALVLSNECATDDDILQLRTSRL